MIIWSSGRPGPGLNPGLFLLPGERQQGERYRHPGRHRQWLLGRALAKQLLVELLNSRNGHTWSPRDIVVERNEQGAPRARTADGQSLGVSLSISHHQELALCALCPEDAGSLGVDLERVEPRAPAFLEDYYTPAEQRLVAEQQLLSSEQAVTVLWCLKEAGLKALGTGLAVNPARIQTQHLEAGPCEEWNPARVSLPGVVRALAWWRLHGELAMGMVLALRPEAQQEPAAVAAE